MKRYITLTILTLGILFVFAGTAFSICTADGSVVRVRKFRAGNFEYVDFFIKRPSFANFSGSVLPQTGPFTRENTGTIVPVAGTVFRVVTLNHVFTGCKLSPVVSSPTTTIQDVVRLQSMNSKVVFVIGYDSASNYREMTVTNVSATRTRVRLRFDH